MLRLLRRFARDRSGVSAVEFALILPVLLLIYIGSVETSAALSADRKVDRAAGTLGDLVAQDDELTVSEMENILDASAAIIEPHSTDNLTIVVAAIDFIEQDGLIDLPLIDLPLLEDGEVVPVVAWSAARNTEPFEEGNLPPIEMPEGIATAGQQIIVAMVTYSFSTPFSAIAAGITGHNGYLFVHTYFLRPRQSQTIVYSGS
jgi:Flp pilus assembly pilin Flp